MGKWRRCARCGQGLRRHYYMVHDRVWAGAGFGARDHAHLQCLADALGRALTPDDFTNAPCNEVLHVAFAIGAGS